MVLVTIYLVKPNLLGKVHFGEMFNLVLIRYSFFIIKLNQVKDKKLVARQTKFSPILFVRLKMIFFLLLLGLVSWTAFAKQYLNSPYSADQPSYNSKRVLRRLEILEEKDLEKNEIIKMLKNEIFVLKQMVNKAQERSKTLNNESNRKKDTPKKGIRHQVMDLKDENPGKNSTTDKDYESDAKSDTKRNKTADHVGSMILQTRDDSDILNQGNFLSLLVSTSFSFSVSRHFTEK